jgi:hypothetical protein
LSPNCCTLVSGDPRWVTGQPPATPSPQVRQRQLYVDCATGPHRVCALDSAAWFTWLESAAAFRYQTTATFSLAHGYTRPAAAISLRKEPRRRGFFWYAYLRKGGQLLKRYVGRSAALTAARLDAVAIDLNLG